MLQTYEEPFEFRNQGDGKGQGNIKDHSHQGIILKLTNCLNHKGHLLMLNVRGANKNQTQ